MITKLYDKEKELTTFPCRGTFSTREWGAD